MIEEKDILRADQDALLQALRDAGADIRRPNAILCPFHDDRSASAGVYEDAGVWRFKCHAASCGFNGDVFDVRSRLSGRPVGEELASVRPVAIQPRPKPKAKLYKDVESFVKSHPHTVATYCYTDPTTGRIDLIKLRMEPPGERKTFTQAHVNADGYVEECAPPKPWPIYNRTRVRDSEEIIVVEGEKCVHALASANMVATCCSGGGGRGSAGNADWTPMRGKTVFLWPDHDPANESGTRGGHEHMREVAEILKGLDCRLYWINPDKIGMKDKEDAADYLARFDPDSFGDAISDVLDIAQPMGASTELRQFLQDAIDGKRYAQAFPFAILSNLSKALQPGCITVVCGEAGSAKSLFGVQCDAFWTANGVRTSVFMLEDDRMFHLARVLAQLSGVSDITDPEWVRRNPEEAMAIEEEHRTEIDLVGRTMYDAPEEPPTYEQLLAWMQQQCDSGSRILIIDPVTAVEAGDKPWKSDKLFMAKAKVILRRSMASLILVTHPREAIKGNAAPRQDQLAGSKAFPRFAQTVLWIVPTPADRKRRVQLPLGTSEMTVNRIIHLIKVRNGKGEGARICFSFSPMSLKFAELGLDKGEAKQNGQGIEDVI